MRPLEKSSPAQIALATDAVRIVCAEFGEAYKAIRGTDQYSNLARARWVLALVLTDVVHLNNQEVDQIIGKCHSWTTKARRYYLDKASKEPALIKKYEACYEAVRKLKGETP